MNEDLEGGRDFDPDDRPELPPPDFDFLVYSLRLQAELNLGLLPFAGGFGEEKTGEEKQEPDFDLARHNIDLLAMLQEKTKGNLTAEEQRALDNSVTELRFRFVQAMEHPTA
jgi:hypothetical protein